MQKKKDLATEAAKPAAVLDIGLARVLVAAGSLVLSEPYLVRKRYQIEPSLMGPAGRPPTLIQPGSATTK